MSEHLSPGAFDLASELARVKRNESLAAESATSKRRLTVLGSVIGAAVVIISVLGLPLLQAIDVNLVVLTLAVLGIAVKL